VSKSVESEGWRLASSGGPEIVRTHSHAARPTGIAVSFDNAGSAGASSHGRAGPLTPSSGTRSRLTKTATDSSVETRMPHMYPTAIDGNGSPGPDIVSLLLIGLMRLGLMAFQFDDDQVHLLVAGVFRQVGGGGGVLRIAPLDGKVLRFPIGKGELPSGVG